MPPKAVFSIFDVQRILSHLGIGPHYTGYRYAEYALMSIQEDEDRLLSVSKTLYPDIAAHFHTTCSAVERNLRTLAEVAWRSEPELLQLMAGHPMDKRPQASKFLGMLWIYLAYPNPDLS